MRLTFHTTSLAPLGSNSLMPRLSKFEWIVPRDRFTPDDYFVIGYLIATSARPDQLNDIDLLSGIAGDLPADPDFYSAINRRIYVPLIKSLKWQSSARMLGVLCPTTPQLRQAIATPLKTDFDEPLTGTSQLQFKVDGKEFNYGGGSAAYANTDVQGTTTTPASPWFRPSAIGGRVLVTVDIPVRILPETASRFVPVHTSVADLESELGVNVAGIRRSREFIKAIQVENQLFGEERDSVISDDQYFTIWFDHWRGWARHEKTHALVTRKIDKNNVLLAPGDVIVLEQHRQKATDDPGVR